MSAPRQRRDGLNGHKSLCFGSKIFSGTPSTHSPPRLHDGVVPAHYGESTTWWWNSVRVSKGASMRMYALQAWNEVDHILIPFLTSSPHWFLIQINLAQQHIFIFDSLPSTSIMIWREQLQTFNAKLTRVLQSIGFLCGGHLLTKPMGISMVTDGVPSQDDDTSCGFFICHLIRILAPISLPTLAPEFQRLCTHVASFHMTPAQYLRQQTALFMYT